MMVKTRSAEFVHRQGDTFNPRFYLRDGDGGQVDPTGMVFVLRMIKTLGSAAVDLERTSENGGVAVDFDTDRDLYYAQPVISDEDTKTIEPARYKFEFRVTDSAGDTGTLAVGTIDIRREIDR